MTLQVWFNPVWHLKLSQRWLWRMLSSCIRCRENWKTLPKFRRHLLLPSPGWRKWNGYRGSVNSDLSITSSYSSNPETENTTLHGVTCKIQSNSTLIIPEVDTPSLNNPQTRDHSVRWAKHQAAKIYYWSLVWIPAGARDLLSSLSRPTLGHTKLPIKWTSEERMHGSVPTLMLWSLNGHKDNFTFAALPWTTRDFAAS
jgi:hypothetical protein